MEKDSTMLLDILVFRLTISYCTGMCHSVFGPHWCNVGIRIYGVTFHKITICSTIYILFDSHWKYIIKRIYYNTKQIIIYWNEPLNNLEKLDNP